jgi:VWFA-related protein
MRTTIITLLILTVQSSGTDVESLMKRASVYANEYMQQLGSIVGQESYVQEARWEDLDNHDRTLHAHRERTMVSDFLSLPIGQTWIGFRHVRQVDGIAVDPLYKDVVRQVFDETTSEGRQQLQERLTFESSRYNIGDFTRPTSLPTFPLEILDSDNLDLFDFSDAGEEVIDNVHTRKVQFTDHFSPSFLMKSGVGPSPRVSLSGTFWVEPVTGRVYQSEIAFTDPRKRKSEMRMQVRFRPDPSLAMLVPISMEEHFRDPVLHHEVDCYADYTKFRRFETGVLLSDQDPPGGPPADPDLRRQGDDKWAVKVDVPLVNVNAWVTANTGQAIQDLQAQDFVILENGTEQTITNFSSVDTPYDVLLLFDHSGSTVTEWTLMQRASETFISNLRPQDRAVVATFDTSLRVLTRWADKKEQIVKTIAGLARGQRPGGTAFYKAVEQSLAAELPPVTGRRRALVVLSDGRDNGLFDMLFHHGQLLTPQKETAFQQMLALIKRERIPIYTVSVNGSTYLDEVDLLNKYFTHSLADRYLEAVRIRLEAVAESSGGRVIFSNKMRDVIPLYSQISRELGSAYSIGYVSNIPPSVHGFREITVITRDKRLHIIQSRAGYELEPGTR